jgi:polyisoprenoid-binding protein YceI
MTDTHPVSDLLRSGAAQGQWTLDPANSTVKFRVKHFWHAITVSGLFEQIEGAGTVAPDGSVSGQLTMQAGSVSTSNSRRDKHLRSADFFDAEQHPLVVLTVTGADPASNDEIAVRGTLQAAGRSQPVSFTARAEDTGPDAVTLRAEVVVDRTVFGMTWSPLGIAAKEAAGSVVARFTRSPTGS